jgi:hypothetical protein
VDEDCFSEEMQGSTRQILWSKWFGYFSKMDKEVHLISINGSVDSSGSVHGSTTPIFSGVTAIIPPACLLFDDDPRGPFCP